MKTEPRQPGLLTGLSGCTDVKEVLGYTKQSPDEFQVYARAPLSLPPDYNLRPPAVELVLPA